MSRYVDQAVRRHTGTIIATSLCGSWNWIWPQNVLHEYFWGRHSETYRKANAEAKSAEIIRCRQIEKGVLDSAIPFFGAAITKQSKENQHVSDIRCGFVNIPCICNKMGK